MTFKVGDSVRIFDCPYLRGTLNGRYGRVIRIFTDQENTHRVKLLNGEEFNLKESEICQAETPAEFQPLRTLVESTSDHTVSSVNPNHYKFPGGIEVRQISAHLTSFGGQALQYIARATRLDGNNKGEAVEDLEKAVRLIQWEIERIKADG